MAIKISIVIPTFNRAALLRKCLDMLMIQDFPGSDYEIIVVSDGPDMATVKVVAAAVLSCRNTPSIRYLNLPVRRGPAAARNLGWHNAHGTLIAFTDDDCVPNIHWLSAIWQSYREQDEVAFSGRIIVPRPVRPTDYERNVSHLEDAEFATANCSCTRRALEKVNGFDERFSVAWREDSDLEFSLLRHHIPVEHVEEARIVHPVRPSSWGVSLREQRKSMFNALLYKKHPLLYKTRIQACPPWHYYATVTCFVLFVIFLCSFSSSLPSAAALAGWLALSTWFISKRLAGNSRTGGHVVEIIVTSLFIPFLSIFWRLCGSVKYKIFFL
jgi:glycosyltransferase involved in cell wall biosynthesis